MTDMPARGRLIVGGSVGGRASAPLVAPARRVKRGVKGVEETQVDLVLDSGAFTAWTRQEEIDVNDYIDFIDCYREYIAEAVNLDMIPGSWGRKPTHHQVEESARRGWENLLVMRKARIDPIAVFHQGERFYWLEKMIKEGCNYIGISPANDRTTRQKQEWLDQAFTFICGDTGIPQIKAHGFGVTSIPLLARYPWFTVDSVRWLLVGAYGGILVPPWVDGKYDYTLSPEVVALSARSGSSKQLCSRQIDGVGAQHRKYIVSYIELLGMTLDELRENTYARERFNIRYFLEVCKAKPIKPFRAHCEVGFFQPTLPRNIGKTYQLKVPKMRVIFATNPTPIHSRILQEEGIRDRLLSYYYLVRDKRADLQYYVKTGFMPERDK